MESVLIVNMFLADATHCSHLFIADILPQYDYDVYLSHTDHSRRYCNVHSIDVIYSCRYQWHYLCRKRGFSSLLFAPLSLYSLQTMTGDGASLWSPTIRLLSGQLLEESLSKSGAATMRPTS